MAIAVQWQTVVTGITTATNVYTVPSASTVPYGTYARDLVVNNSGTATVFVGLGATASTATTAASFLIPAGGSVILTQCQVPAGAVVSAVAANPASVSVGFATNVAYI